MFLNPRVASPRSLKDILYKKRMERQLAAARGLGPMGERPPDEDGGGVGPGGIPTAGSKVAWVDQGLADVRGNDMA